MINLGINNYRPLSRKRTPKNVDLPGDDYDTTVIHRSSQIKTKINNNYDFKQCLIPIKVDKSANWESIKIEQRDFSN